MWPIIFKVFYYPLKDILKEIELLVTGYNVEYLI